MGDALAEKAERARVRLLDELMAATSQNEIDLVYAKIALVERIGQHLRP